MSAETPAAARSHAQDELAALRARIVAEPSVVLDDPEVMRALLNGHGAEDGRKIVDLRGALIARLEARLGELEETHRSVITAAYENVAGANAIHRAVLAMLTPRKFSEALDALGGEIPAMLGVEQVRLGLETTTPDGAAPDVIAALPMGGVESYVNLGREEGHRRVVLRPVRADLPGADALFGAETAGLSSEALIRLDFGDHAAPGLLAFGSADPERFVPEQGGDLLDFFGGVVERTIRRWVA